MTFTVKCEMEDRWANDFCCFLKQLQINGEQGHSSLIGFYADGDGDFRPKFSFDGIKPIKQDEHKIEGNKFGWDKQCEFVFDAG